MKKFSQNFYKSFSIIETLKKKKREKILFPLILLSPFRHLYSLFISNQLQVANAWSIQQLLRANKSPRFFLSSSQSIQRNLFEIYRELSSTRITRVSILGGNWEAVYYLYYRLLFREILEEERNLGGGQSRRNFIRDYSGKGTAFLSPGTGSRRRDNGKKNGSSFIRHSDEQREKSFGWFILE